MAKSFVKMGMIALIAGMLATPAWAEEADQEVKENCAKEAQDAGITDAGERDAFIKECIAEAKGSK